MPAKRKRTAGVPAIRLTVDIAAPPARVFKALTDSRHIKAWSGAPGRVARRAGGPFRMWDGWNTGTVLSRRAPTALAYTWRKDDWAPGTKDSVVRWTLKATAKGTRLVMVHSKLPSMFEYRDHKSGWPRYFLKPMGRYLEKRW
ncbi:MAG TPA: SRPBCC domain-containing protein [Gemmatimonadales bacterium]|nr:SRPBCC domain-containing protein [Gemmatimonadales bacterium]